MSQPYYMAYEERYRRVFEAGIDLWGHSPADETLFRTLAEWVETNGLAGKTVVDYACGEGGAGVILSKLGCVYRGIDVSPSAVAKARERLTACGCTDATAECLDMVREAAGLPETADAALDCMGLHMILTDADRDAYLKNAYTLLKPGAPMLFFRESYRDSAYTGVVTSCEQWQEITGEDYVTPQVRRNGEKEVLLPLIPARARNREGYTAEMERAGFLVENLVPMEVSSAIIYSASIYVRKL